MMSFMHGKDGVHAGQGEGYLKKKIGKMEKNKKKLVTQM
jgi:hypothetical protein